MAPLALLLLGAALHAAAPESINDTASQSGEVFVTAAFGGAARQPAEQALGALVALLLRQHGVHAAAAPPPPACRAADARACAAAALQALAARRLHVALLPLAPAAAPPPWALRDAGLELVGDAAPALRRQCRAPRPPARSLLDLADPAAAAAYPAPRRPLPAPALQAPRCAAEACAALLVADDAEVAALAPAVHSHDLLVRVYVVGEDLASFAALPRAEAPLMCDLALEIAVPAVKNWTVLGPPPCLGNETCPFESRSLAIVANVRELARTPRALCALGRLTLDAAALGALLAAARAGAEEAAARELAARPRRCAAREVRVAALLPLGARGEVAAPSALLAAAQLAEEDEQRAPGAGGAGGAAPRFKVEVYDAACSSRRAYKYLLDALGTAEFGALAAVAGPVCAAAWADVARQSVAHALPQLGVSAVGAGSRLALRGAGAAEAGGAALAAWLAARGWRRAALLAGAGAAPALLAGEAPALRLELALHTTLPDADAAEVDLELVDQWAARAAALGARVLVLWAADARWLRAALCAARARRLLPRAGVVLLLPPLGARLLRAAPRERCAAAELAEMLDGHFTVAPAWQAAWEGWDAPAAANQTSGAAAAWRARLQQRCRRWARAGGAGGAGRAGGAECDDSAGAAVLYDMLRLWARALRRLHAAAPQALDDLHDPAVASELVSIAAAEEYEGVTGTVRWQPAAGGGWQRAGAQLVAQWQAGAWRQVAAWDGGALRERPGALRWRTPDGRQPDDGAAAACVLGALATALGTSCGAAWALAAALALGALLALLTGAALHWRRRAERSFRRRLAAIGLRALPPAGTDRWELPRERVVINRKLGTGAFGTVYGGHALLGERGWTAVAVKTLKPGASTEEKLDFLAEAEAMKRLDHENVVRLLGVITKTEPVCAVMEFMLYGDLKTYLLARRHVADEREVGARRLTALARDAARALSYLATQRWVHGDVAARNCLVSARRGLKLADFGLARRVFDADYYRCLRRGLLPVRWMAPEALARGALSPASDVWALGVLLYEMVTLGALPFAGLSTPQVLARLRQARAPDVPPGIKPQLEGLMKSCWAAEPRARPAAAEVAALLAECPRLVTAAPPDPAPLWRASRASEGPASGGTDTTYLSSTAARDTDRFLPDEDDTPEFVDDEDRWLADV